MVPTFLSHPRGSDAAGPSDALAHIVATPCDAVVIGVSAGAVQVLDVILPALPAHAPFPTLVVVHLPPRGPSLLVEIFGRRCQVEVQEVCDKSPARPGVISFAPPDYHLLVESDRTLALSIDPPVNFSRPSIDVLFTSQRCTEADWLRWCSPVPASTVWQGRWKCALGAGG